MTARGTEHDGDGEVLAVRDVDGHRVTLRRARAADVVAIVDLLAADQLAAARDGVRTDADLAAYLHAFSLIDADPAHLLVAGWRDGRLVATMQLTRIPGLSRRGGTRMQIEAVRVHGSLRGAGVGTFLVEWAIDEARRRGCSLVQLTTDKRRADARRFYDRLGFAATHEGMKLPL